MVFVMDDLGRLREIIAKRLSNIELWEETKKIRMDCYPSLRNEGWILALKWVLRHLDELKKNQVK